MSHLRISLALLLLINLTLAQEFYGGFMSYAPQDPTQTTMPINIVWTHRFLYDLNSVNCKTPANVAAQTPIGNGDFQTICTDYNIADAWSAGKATKLVSMSELVIMDALDGCCWPTSGFNTLNGNGHWSFQFIINLIARPDNGKINTSPSLPDSLNLVFKFRLNCNSPISVLLPVTDADGDTVKCRCSDDTCIPGSENKRLYRQTFEFWEN